MALANINNQKRQVMSGLLAGRPIAAIFYGDIYYATDTTLWYIYTPSGWVEESLPGIDALSANLVKWGSAGYDDEQITVNALKTLTAAKINPVGVTETLVTLSVDTAPIRYRIGANATDAIGVQLATGDSMVLELDGDALIALTMFAVSGTPVVNVQYLYR